MRVRRDERRSFPLFPFFHISPQYAFHGSRPSLFMRRNENGLVLAVMLRIEVVMGMSQTIELKEQRANGWNVVAFESEDLRVRRKVYLA